MERVLGRGLGESVEAGGDIGVGMGLYIFPSWPGYDN